MGKSLIDVDDELLAQARQILGVTTKKDTVNAALRELVRRRTAEEFIELGHGGAFNGLRSGS